MSGRSNGKETLSLRGRQPWPANDASGPCGCALVAEDLAMPSFIAGSFGLDRTRGTAAREASPR